MSDGYIAKSGDMVIDLIHATKQPDLTSHLVTLLRNAATEIATLRAQATTQIAHNTNPIHPTPSTHDGHDITTLLRNRACKAGLPWTADHPEQDHGHTDCWLNHKAANEIDRLRDIIITTLGHDATWCLYPQTVDNPPPNPTYPVDNPDQHRDFLSDSL